MFVSKSVALREVQHLNTFAMGDCHNSFFFFLLAIVPDLALLNISARFVFLKSCAVNKKRLFLPFLFSVWIPPQVRLEKRDVLLNIVKYRITMAALSPPTPFQLLVIVVAAAAAIAVVAAAVSSAASMI